MALRPSAAFAAACEAPTCSGALRLSPQERSCGDLRRFRRGSSHVEGGGGPRARGTFATAVLGSTCAATDMAELRLLTRLSHFDVY